MFRDNEERWIVGFKRKRKCPTVLYNELMAISEGLLIIVDRGWRNIVLHTDSQLAVTLLLDDNQVPDANLNLILNAGIEFVNRITKY